MRLLRSLLWLCLCAAQVWGQLNISNTSGTVVVQQSTPSNLKVDLSGTGTNSNALAVSGTITATAGTGTFTNQQSNITGDFDTSGGSQNLTMFGLALPASGGAVAGGTATNPIQVSLANTAANATAVTVSGSVTSNQGGTWTVQPGNTANSTAWLVTDKSTGSTAAAVPASAIYVGGVSSGNLAGVVACDSSAFINASTATTTQLVALVSGKSIYVCGVALSNGATAQTAILKYGTGTACGTGTTSLSMTYSLPVNGQVSFGGGLGYLMKAPASDALCVTNSAAATIGVQVSYTQF